MFHDPVLAVIAFLIVVGSLVLVAIVVLLCLIYRIGSILRRQTDAAERQSDALEALVRRVAAS